MEQIGQITNNCNTKANIMGCANNVPYLMIVSDGCCDDSTLKYINLVDGTITYTRPTDFTIGECKTSDCPPIFETESFTATAGQITFTLSNAPYQDVVFTRNGATLVDTVATVSGNVVTYVVSENDNNALLADDDITISYLYKDPNCSTLETSSSICFSFNDGGTNTEIKAIYLNGTISYYENGTKVTDATRISQIEGFIANATSDNVICCSDCSGGTSTNLTDCIGNTLPNGSSVVTCSALNNTQFGINSTTGEVTIISSIESPQKQCYSLCNPKTIIANSFGPLLYAPTGTTQSRAITKIQIYDTSNVLKGTLDLSSSPITYVDNGVVITNKQLEERLKAAGYEDLVKSIMPAINTFSIRYDAISSQFFCYAYDSINNSNQMLNYYVDITRAVDGSTKPVDSFTSSSTTWVDDCGGIPTDLSIVTNNNTKTYYVDGKVVTDPTQIASLQAKVDLASYDEFTCCCDPADGSETKVQAGQDISVTGTGTTSDPYIVSYNPASSPAFTNTVYFNYTDPNSASATIFDLNNPPTTNNNTLRKNSQNLYIGTDGLMWIYNSATDTYTAYTFPDTFVELKVKTASNPVSAMSLIASPSILTGYTLVNHNVNTNWSNSTGTMTITKAGFYEIGANVCFTGTFSIGNYGAVSLFKNGSRFDVFSDRIQYAGSANIFVSGSTRIYLNVGDVIGFGVSSNTACTLDSYFILNNFYITLDK